MRTVVLSVGVALFWTSRLVGQAPLAEGDRVRLSAPSFRLEARIGSVRSVANDRLVFRPADSTESVELNFKAISSLERSEGKKPGIAPGVIYGTGAGLVVGGILGATCKGGLGDNCNSRWIARGAAGGLALGLIAGFTVLRTDRWFRLTLPSGRAGLGFESSIRF